MGPELPLSAHLPQLSRHLSLCPPLPHPSWQHRAEVPRPRGSLAKCRTDRHRLLSPET